MSVEMTPLEIVGLKADLWATVRTLQHLGCVQIEELDGSLYPPGAGCGAQAHHRPAGTVGGEKWLR